MLHVSAAKGDLLHKRAGVRAWNFENDRYEIIKGTKVLYVREWQQLACKNKCLCLFLSFSMLPSLPQRIHTNMRAVLRLYCTGGKGRPE